MGQQIRQIEVGRIRPNLRIVCAAGCIEEIAYAIKAGGQQEPILICFEHDSFRILDGEKRWRAAKKLGMNTIGAVIA